MFKAENCKTIGRNSRGEITWHMKLEVINLHKRYAQGSQHIDALKGVSLRAGQSEFISIMGPSGSGKSSLLQIVGGLDRPTSGSVHFDGKGIESLSDKELSLFRRRKLGFIFQFFHLLPTLTAAENVALPAILDGKTFQEVEKKACDLLARTGLGKRKDHYPAQLSGGEMQRVAIARSLINDPLLILADEPTGNLDSKTGATILELLQKLVKEEKYTILMVTHDKNAASYGTKLVQFRDGSIESEQSIS